MLKRAAAQLITRLKQWVRAKSMLAALIEATKLSSLYSSQNGGHIVLATGCQ